MSGSLATSAIIISFSSSIFTFLISVLTFICAYVYICIYLCVCVCVCVCVCRNERKPWHWKTSVEQKKVHKPTNG